MRRVSAGWDLIRTTWISDTRLMTGLARGCHPPYQRPRASVPVPPVYRNSFLTIEMFSPLLG